MFLWLSCFPWGCFVLTEFMQNNKSGDILPFFLLACHRHPSFTYSISDDPYPLAMILASTPLIPCTKFYCKPSAGTTGWYVTPSFYDDIPVFLLTHGLVTSTCRGQPRFLECWRQQGWSWSCVIVITKRGGDRSGIPWEAVTISVAKQDAATHNHLQLNVDRSYCFSSLGPSWLYS